jgi:hypothetical protein
LMIVVDDQIALNSNKRQWTDWDGLEWMCVSVGGVNHGWCSGCCTWLGLGD